MALTMWGQVIIQAATPQEDPVQVGTIWVDTSGTPSVKVCTSVSPYTFAATGGGGVPDAHASSHQNGGADEISVAGLSGLLADGQTALAHATSHQNGGSDEISVAGLSGLLADAQTPIAHATSHQNGGSDEISIAGLSGIQLSFLASGSGSTTNTSAENLDSVALSGLTGVDSIFIVYNFNAVTQGVAALTLRNDTDGVTISDIGSAAAGAGKVGWALLKQSAQANTTLHTFALRTSFGGVESIDGQSVAVTTAWTGSWTLALRQPGVTAGGTLYWSWAAFSIKGQL